MSNSNRTAGRNVFGATVIAAALVRGGDCRTGPRLGGRRLRAHPQREDAVRKDPPVRRKALTVRAAQGTRYRTLYTKGDPLPVAIRLDDGALLIEFHPASPQEKFQILTPLAIAAVRGTKWAMEVTKARTSTLVLAGAVAVTNRRLNQYVVLNEGEGVDITPTDTSMVQNVGRRAGCGRFFPVSESEWRPSGRDLPGS